MKTIIMISHLLLVSFLYLSCNDEDNNKNLDVNELKNEWVLQRTIDKQTGDIDSIKKGATGVLTFHGENCVMVDGPYNIGAGKFELNGNNLSISIILRTQYDSDSFYTDCGFIHPVILDDIFFNNLNGSYSIKGDKLTINSEGDFDLEFYKADLKFIFNCFEAKPGILIDSIPENK